MKIKTVGLIGYGRFGKMAFRYLSGGCPVRVFDPDRQPGAGATKISSLAEVIESDAIVLAVPISAIAAVCREIGPQLRPRQVVIDVCSVKAVPLAQMESILPTNVDIVGTHPLFGPDSGQAGIAGLKIAVCPVRVSEGVLAQIIAFLKGLELQVIRTTAVEHDRQMAKTQAIFHWIAQAVKELGWGPQQISTPGPDAFFDLLKTVQQDTAQLFHDLETCNPHAKEARRVFIEQLKKLVQELDSES